MKYRMLWRSTFREIGQSMGRYLAILAIVALGVGFFAGLKVTDSAMKDTVTTYFNERGFYDYRLISTLGFGDRDIENLKNQEDVRDAEGSISFDVIYSTAAGAEGVVKAYSLPRHVNVVQVVSGRLPSRENECVVDSGMSGTFRVGDVVTLSQNNSEDDLEHFTCREYRVVGLVQSPLYIQFERGTTTLGNGKLNGFLYLPRDGFAVDYYTEVYVRFAQDFDLYSPEYDAYLEEKEAVWEAVAEDAETLRYEHLMEDAREEIASARQELADKRAEALEALADARAQLDEGEEQLLDGEHRFADARRELEEARDTLAKEERSLRSAKATIAQKEAQLAEAEAAYQAGLETYRTQKEAFAKAESELNGNDTLLTAQTHQTSVSQMTMQRMLNSINEEREDIKKSLEILAEQEKIFDEEEASYGGSVPEDAARELAKGRQWLDGEIKRLKARDAQLAQQMKLYGGLQTTINDGASQIGAYNKQLEEGKKQLEEGRAALEAAKKQLDAARKQITDGKVDLADAKEQIQAGERQLADAREQLLEGERTLEEESAKVRDAREQFEDGLREYWDGYRTLEEETAEAEAKIADAEDALSDIKTPEIYLLGRNTNIGYVCFENDSVIVEGIANVFPVFFFLVAALVCITTMNRMVEEQRTQIGVLKALGYSRGRIMGKYLFYAGSAAALGCFLGYFGGCYLFPRVIWFAYGIMYRVGPLEYVLDHRMAWIVLAVSMLCSVGTAYLSCRAELAQVAAQLMRPRAPRAGKRILLERIGFIWRRLKFLQKVSARNIFRYKKRMFMMLVGISGCTALLLTGFGIKDSIADVAGQQFREVQVYDISVILSNPLEEDSRMRLEELSEDSIDSWCAVWETNIDLVTKEAVKGITMVVLPEGEDLAPYLNLHTPEGESIPYPQAGEAVFSAKVAKTYGIEPGNTVTLQDSDMSVINVKVTGLMENFIYNYVFLSSATYEEQIGAAAPMKTLYVNCAEGADEHGTARELMELEEAVSVTVNADVLVRMNSMMQSLDLVVVVVLLSAAGLAFIVLYNLTNINIMERVREIATIKVLGFFKKESESYVFRENLLLTFGGAILGLFLGKYLHAFVMNAINVDMVAFKVIVRPRSYVFSVALTVLFAWLVNRLMGRRLEQISMTESLKSVD